MDPQARDLRPACVVATQAQDVRCGERGTSELESR